MNVQAAVDVETPGSRESILKRLIKIAAEVNDVDPDQVAITSDLRNDLGMDSLAVVEFQMATEESFGLTIDDDKLEGIHTIGDVVELVREAMDARS